MRLGTLCYFHSSRSAAQSARSTNVTKEGRSCITLGAADDRREIYGVDFQVVLLRRSQLTISLAGQGSRMKARPKVTYCYGRLTFHRDSIEPLEANDRFRLETPVGAFEMSRAEFCETFPGVVRSRAYAINGLYNYSTVPGKGERFLVNRHP